MKDLKLEPINIVFFSKWDSFEKWQVILIKYNILLHKWPDPFDAKNIYPNIEGALVWDPPNDKWQSFPNLKIIQSLGAGVEHIINKSYPKNVPIIKLSDPDLSNQMSEYIVMSVLMCYRKYFQYEQKKKKKTWNQLIPLDKKDFIITILGYGAISKIIIKRLMYMGFNIKVWSKSKRTPKNINYYYSDKEFHESFNRSSCLISLLPATSSTYNLIGLSEFNKLNSEAYFINAGRGHTVNENELIIALKKKILTGAILDVYSKEPLTKSSKLWELDNVILTPHIAGITNATDHAAKLLRNNFDLLRLNKSLKNRVYNTKDY